MFRIIRTTTLRADRAELGRVRAELEQSHAAAAAAQADATDLRDQLFEVRQVRREKAEQAEQLCAVIEKVTDERDTARTVVVEAQREVAGARAQVLLDAEDRVALRFLLRSARRQASRPRVYALFRFGALHSVHTSAEEAESAAEAEGAPRSGWISPTPGAALPPATETAWRVQSLPLGGTP